MVDVARGTAGWLPKVFHPHLLLSFSLSARAFPHGARRAVRDIDEDFCGAGYTDFFRAGSPVVIDLPPAEYENSQKHPKNGN